MKTICIAGKNDIAVDVLLYCIEHYSENRIVCVLTQNEKGVNLWQKSLKWFCKTYSIEILELQEVYNIEDLLFLSLEFDRIIRIDKFASSELYNIHFSMLPRYKGMLPAVLPILNGESFTGVTLHKIRAGIDTGEIIAQRRVEIEKKDTSLDLYHKLIRNGTELVISKLETLLSGNVEMFQQGGEGSTYFSTDAVDYANLTLNVNKTAYQIQNQIRAFCFRPYQILGWNGIKYIECKILDELSIKKPGTILEETDTYVKIATIDYDVLLFKDVLTELLSAIMTGNNELAKTLCISNKIINEQESHGWSALTIAVYNNNFEMVKFLYEKGADINILDYNGNNLLMYAKKCYMSFKDAVIFDFLYERGLNPNKTNYLGKNVYDYCKEGIEASCIIQL